MPRTVVASLLTAALLGVGAIGRATAQESEQSPVGMGGRVEVPDVGFALTFPDEWVYIFPSAEDTSAVLDSVTETVPDLAPVIEAALQQGVAFSLIAFGGSDEASGFTENCNVIAAASGGVTLDVAVASEVASYGQLGEQLSSGPDVTMVELPAGRAAQVDYSLQLPAYETQHVAYYFTDGSTFYVLTCTGVERPEDDWQSIAQTFEFVPAAE